MGWTSSWVGFGEWISCMGWVWFSYQPDPIHSSCAPMCNWVLLCLHPCCTYSYTMPLLSMSTGLRPTKYLACINAITCLPMFVALAPLSVSHIPSSLLFAWLVALPMLNQSMALLLVAWPLLPSTLAMHSYRFVDLPASFETPIFSCLW